MESVGARARDFDHLREHSIGLPQVLFQSITHMAPGAAIAFSILVSVQFAGPALPLAVLAALVACLLVASSIGQLAKEIPSAGGLYSYVARALGPAPGFMVGWAYLLFQPLVAPLLFLIFAWATDDVWTSEKNGLGVGTAFWPVWVILAAAIVFFLTYRDVRLSTNAGIVLGIFEIAVFLALAAWMILSNAGDITLQTFNPSNNEVGTLEGTFKGMVFAILAFIGFESSAPLGEEAQRPRWTIPRAVVGSAFLIGLFYVFTSYAWVIGTGFADFTEVTTAAANPWKDLGIVFWGGGWVLVFFAIINSAIANANAGVNAATRVLYSMGRNGVLPKAFARTHPVHRTPHVATLVVSIGGLIIALLMGWKWDPLTAFVIIATAVTIVVICVYITVCVACAAYYWREKRSEWNPWLHGVFPAVGALAFLAPLYYQFNPLPPYPIRYANWIAVGWLAAGVLVTAYMAKNRREALVNAGRIFVEDETVATRPSPTGETPVAD
ncbi:MAG: APC family permease [Actinobacteria bacterium]|nr:APC family permease [Actinomycetota bacterium]